MKGKYFFNSFILFTGFVCFIEKIKQKSYMNNKEINNYILFFLKKKNKKKIWDVVF